MLELDSKEVAWAGGLFEGEGTFSHHVDSRGPRVYVHPVAAIQMTDLDVMQRFGKAIPLRSNVMGPYTRWSRKPSWRWQVYGFEQTQALLAMLWPWLGERRRAQAKAVLYR